MVGYLKPLRQISNTIFFIARGISAIIKMKIKRLKRETKIDIVFAIVYGNMTLSEAMQKYEISKKSTITSWIKALLPEAKLLLSPVKEKGADRVDFENIGMEMFARIERLEYEKSLLEDQTLALTAELRRRENKKV